MTVRPGQRSLAKELAIACAVAGVTQRQIADRLSVSQTTVCRLLTGSATLHVDTADAIARACGHRLVIRVAPGDGIGLRDSGQMALAKGIQANAERRWRVRLEVPVAAPPDRRAVDMVLIGPEEVLAIEIERWLRDFQAQLRAAQLKRLALAERMGRPVRVILAVPDSAATRRRLQPYAELIARELPVSSRTAWARVRSGEPLGGDALLWVRP